MDAHYAKESYFNRPETRDLLNDLSGRSHVTLLTGAGWSRDFGLPTWNRLVSLLIKQAYSEDGQYNSQLADELIRIYGLPGSALIAREIIGERRFENVLKDTLYKESVGLFGRSALSVANLFYEWASPERSIYIATTNYDRSLETALEQPQFQELREYLKIKSFKSVDDPEEAKRYISSLRRRKSGVPSEFPIFHLHGTIPKPSGKSATNIVFSEEDYADQYNSSSSWQQAFFKLAGDRENSAFLMLGMSLTDPNIFRLLRQAPARNTTIFLPSQDLASIEVEDAQMRGQLSRTLQEGADSRLEILGIAREQPDFYIQGPQFLNELAVSVRHPEPEYSESGNTYWDRLERWSKLMQASNRLKRTNPQFADAQKTNRWILSILRTYLETVLRKPSNSGSASPSEHFAVQLWLRNPRTARTTLEMWGSSEKAWFEPKTIRDAAASATSEFNSVRAFCNGGSRFLERSSKVGGRWQTSMTILLELTLAPWYRLPVGAIALESTAPPEDSRFRYLKEGANVHVVRVMTYVGRLLASPGVSNETLEHCLDFLNDPEPLEPKEVEDRLKELIESWAERCAFDGEEIVFADQAEKGARRG